MTRIVARGTWPSRLKLTVPGRLSIQPVEAREDEVEPVGLEVACIEARYNLSTQRVLDARGLMPE